MNKGHINPPAGGGAPARLASHEPLARDMLLSVYGEERVFLLRAIRSFSRCAAGMEEDILQEAVERLLARAAAGLILWENCLHCRNSILKTARNIAIDMNRSERRRVRTTIYQSEMRPHGHLNKAHDPFPDDPGELHADGSADGPEEQLMRREEMVRARSILSALDPEERELLLKREELGMSWEEISSLLDVRPEALRMRYSRLKRRLRRLYEEDCA